MCGIMGYKGDDNATDIVIEGLKSLEYRGYDSWGIAIKKSEIKTIKEVGKVGEFNDTLPESNIAIGHTRWATHGKVTKENAHPHTDCFNNIAVVHNGIIENHQELKKELISKGHNFKSETDTEVIPHLIEDLLKEKPLLEAVKETVKKLEGNFAIIVIKNDENRIIAARKGSPLVLGIKGNEYFLASDIPAFLKHTNKVVFIEDNELIEINDNLKKTNFETGEEIPIEVTEIEWDLEKAQKGNYPHFMLKEMIEQKESLYNAINQDENKIKEFADAINNSFGTFFVACGTAYHAALTASYLFSMITKKHINVVLGSEFHNYKDFITDKTLVIPISQSGETADVLAAVKSAKEKKAKIYSIINVIGSSAARYSDNYLLINAGPEIAVASTKAFTSQLMVLALLAFTCAGRYQEGKILLNKLADKTKEFLNDNLINSIKNLTESIEEKDFFAIGRSVNYPIALEAALKIKEVSYIHAEGFAGGELKHGPIALIEENTPCLVFVTTDENKGSIISNATEIKSRGGYIIGISPENDKIFNYWIQVPDVGILSPIINVIPAQLFAYYFAIKKGLDPDKPRNLAKSVTVF